MGRKNVELLEGKNSVYIKHIVESLKKIDISKQEFYFSIYAYLKNRLPKITVLNHNINFPRQFLKENEKWVFHKPVYNINALENSIDNVQWDYIISDNDSIKKIYSQLFKKNNSIKIIIIDNKIDDQVKAFYPMHIKNISEKDIEEYNSGKARPFNKLKSIENKLKNFYFGIQTYLEINPVNYQSILVDNAKEYVKKNPERAVKYIGDAWTYRPDLVKEIMDFMESGVIAKYQNSEMAKRTNPAKDLVNTELSKIKRYSNNNKTKLSDLL